MELVKISTDTIFNTLINVKKHLPKQKDNVKIIKNWTEVFGCLSYWFITGNWFPHIVWFNYLALDHQEIKWKWWSYVKTIWVGIALCLAKNILDLKRISEDKMEAWVNNENILDKMIWTSSEARKHSSE